MSQQETNYNRGIMKNTVKARVWAEISAAALTFNLQQIKQYISPLKVMAVLKANAYGLGIEGIAEVLKKAGADCFGVAEVDFALKLKAFGLPVHILGALLDEEIAAVVQADFIAPVGDLRAAQALDAEAQRQGKIAQIQLKVDTGMGRLGMLPAELERELPVYLSLKNTKIVGMYSHFPHGYGDLPFSNKQIDCFKTLLALLRSKGCDPEYLHIANSDGIHNVERALQAPFNMVRTGINLYGVYETEGRKAFDLQEVLTFKTRLITVREMAAGGTIGYGRGYVLKENKRVGTIAAGYADGVPFNIANRGKVMIRGQACPVIGRISMDFTTVDLSALPDAAAGDEVVCLGQGISIEEWAQYRGSIPYDVICALGTRVQRLMVD